MIRSGVRKLSVAGIGIWASIALPVQSAEITGKFGEPLEVTLSWDSPVDLDVFLTDPNGETVYFANRKGKSGSRMGMESGCAKAAQNSGPYRESVKIEEALLGRYRVSVDFIKDCGHSSLEEEFSVILSDVNGNEIDRVLSSVQYRLLNPVAWEFWIQ